MAMIFEKGSREGSDLSKEVTNEKAQYNFYNRIFGVAVGDFYDRRQQGVVLVPR